MASRPLPFSGPEDERQANKTTHQWGGKDGQCFRCGTRPWDDAADYPCGAEVPRRYWINFDE